jgi:hypothetical protein
MDLPPGGSFDSDPQDHNDEDQPARS